MIETLPCPSPEMLAAYLDGKLTPAERVEVERHVATCEDCFDVLAGAAAFQSEEVERGVLTVHPSAQPRRARWIAIAATVAALVVVGLWLRRQPRIPVENAPQVLAWAERLGDASELKTAAARPWTDPGSGLAFAAGLPPAQRAFRVGAHLLDARVALAAREDQLLFDALARAAALLTGESKADAVAERVRRSRAGAEVDLTDEGGLGEDLDRLAAIGRAIAPAAFDLGAWAETGRLASLGGNADLLVSEIADFLDQVIATPAADLAVDRELRAIRDALADRQVSAPELSDLAQSFERLLLLH